jgi:anti-anti-sigma regulatory factor
MLYIYSACAFLFNIFECLSNLFKINGILKTILRMEVKIDTKEKFHVITIKEPELSANMTEDLRETLLAYLGRDVKNVILNFENIRRIEYAAGVAIVSIQQTFYDANSSLVICNLGKEMEKYLDEREVLELMNVTPTESEAWDIVQMEEIEREFDQ